jgi:hypothetical protein
MLNVIDANPVGRYRVEDANPTDGVVAGTAGKVAGTQLGRWPRLGWWLERLEWMPARLDDTGWKMRALPMGAVRPANLLVKDEARMIAANIAKLPHWIKVKNPNAPAVRREAEEDWGNKRWSHAR